MRKYVIAAALLATSTAYAGQLPPGPAAVKSEIPSCGDFKNRLVRAGTKLEFSLPAPKFERTVVTDYDKWWVSYDYGNGAVFEGSITCTDGKFTDYSMEYPTEDGRDGALRRAQIASAAVYAFTGLQRRQMMKLVNDGLRKRPKAILNKDGSSYVPLTKDVSVTLDFNSLLIEAGQ